MGHSPQKKIAIIANSAAGKGSAARMLHEARRSLWGWTIDFLKPNSSEELRNLCSSLSPQQYEAAILVGGDGTIHQALPGLLECGVPLFPFPGGTANDLAAELGIRPDWHQVQSLIDKKLHKKMDLIDVNGIPFATVAGIGIGSLITHALNENRRNSVVFRGMLQYLEAQTYTWLSAKTILFDRGYVHDLHIKSSIFDERIKTGAVFVSNQNHLGKDLRVSSAAENDDETFSVLVVPRYRRHDLIRGLIQMKRGVIPKDFILFSSKHLVIRDLDRRPIRVFGDGEVLVEAPELQFKILPNRLAVYSERRGRKRRKKAGNPE